MIENLDAYIALVHLTKIKEQIQKIKLNKFDFLYFSNLHKILMNKI
jgi:hypothetical protein